MAAEESLPSGRLEGLAERFGGGSFLRAAAVLQVGSLGLTSVGFLASVLLARTLGPNAYGIYSLVISIGTTIGLLRRLGQDYAATTHLAEGHVAGDPRAVRNALVFYVFLSVLTSVVVLPAAIVLAPWIGERYSGDPQFGLLLQLFLVQGFWAVVPGWTVIALQASRRLGPLVKFENVTNLIAYSVPVALALGGLGVIGVFWGQVVASLIGLGLGFAVYSRLRVADPLLPSTGHLLLGAIRPAMPLWAEIKFGLSIAFDKNLVSLYNLVPVLLLGLFAPEAEVGLLRVAIGYMAIPAVLLSPISRLLMVDLPQLRVKAPDQVRAFFLRVTLLGGLASAVLATPFALASWLAVPLLYGELFAAAAPLSLALLLDAATLGLGIAAGPVFRTYNRTDLPIRASLAILCVGLPVSVVIIQAWGSLGAALAYGGMMLALRLVTYAQCLWVIRR